MNFKKILSYAAVAMTLTSCSKIYDYVHPGSGSGSGSNSGTQTYNITEDFESAAKRSYAADTVSLSTGVWYFDDALIGSLSSDAKNGNQSARVREGSISMNFDIDSVKVIYISHAQFGSDGNSTWQLMMSADGGTTYTQVGSDIAETNTTLSTDSFSVSTLQPIRIKIQKTGTTRINLDDITFKCLK